MFKAGEVKGGNIGGFIQLFIAFGFVNFCYISTFNLSWYGSKCNQYQCFQMLVCTRLIQDSEKMCKRWMITHVLFFSFLACSCSRLGRWRMGILMILSNSVFSFFTLPSNTVYHQLSFDGRSLWCCCCFSVPQSPSPVCSWVWTLDSRDSSDSTQFAFSTCLSLI